MSFLDQANQMAGMRFDPMQAAIQNRINLINQQTGIRNQAVQTQGDIGRREVGGAYDTLQGLLGANRTNAMGAINTAANQVGQGYRDAATLGEQSRDRSRTALAELAQRMGAGDYAMPVIGDLESQANQMIQANRDRDATYTGNLRNWGAQAGSIYDQQIGTGHQMRADALSRLESDLVRAVGENNLRGAEEESDMGQQLTELLGERGSYLAEMINQLSAQEFEREIKRAQLELQRAELEQRAAQASAELSLRASEGAADRSLRSAAMAKEGQLSEKEKLQLQMQQWGMDREALESDRSYGLEREKFVQGRQPSFSERLGLSNFLFGDPSVEGTNQGANQAARLALFRSTDPNYRPASSGRNSGLGGGWRSSGASAMRSGYTPSLNTSVLPTAGGSSRATTADLQAYLRRIRGG